jgi:T-complex protein 1 subunit gamma
MVFVGSKDVINDIERNLQDAMQVARNVVFEPLLMTGGGATEMRLAHDLKKRAEEVESVEQFPCRAVAEALEVISDQIAVRGSSCNLLRHPIHLCKQNKNS